MTIALLFSLGTCIVQLQNVRVKFACTKKTFQSLGRSEYQCPQCTSVFQKRNFPFEDQTNSFSSPLVKGLSFLKRLQNQFNRLLEMCIVLASIVSTEKSDNLDIYVTTPISIYASGKRGVWLLVQKVLQEHVKTTTTEKTRLFFAKKFELGTEQTIVT